MTHCNRIRHSRDRDGDAVPGARTFASCRRHRRRRPDAVGSSGVGRRDVVDLVDAGGARQASTGTHHPASRSRLRTRIAARSRTRPRRGTAADPATGTGTGAGDGTRTNPAAGHRSVLGRAGRSNVRPMSPAPGGISAGTGPGSVLPTGAGPAEPGPEQVGADERGVARAATGDQLDTSPEAAAPRRLGSRPVRSARSAAAALASLATHRSPLWRPRP